MYIEAEACEVVGSIPTGGNDIFNIFSINEVKPEL